MNDKQPEALRLAGWFSNEVEDITWRDLGPDTQEEVSVYRSAAAELRRLTEVNQELLKALLMILDDPSALDGRPRTYKYVQAAIAKAKGESNE